MNDAASATSPHIAIPIRDAASVIVLDRGAVGGPSVLMGQRGAQAAFMPSKFVFPGGAVDQADGDLALRLPAALRHSLAAEPRDGQSVTPEAIAAAALRELAEETGLMTGAPGTAPPGWMRYGGAGLAPDAAPLIHVFRAITPPGRSRRFDARFFLLDAEALHGDRHDFSLACDELSHLQWVALPEARGLDLPFITEVVLAEVSAIAHLSGPLMAPASVPFFDNRTAQPRFSRLT